MALRLEIQSCNLTPCSGSVSSNEGSEKFQKKLHRPTMLGRRPRLDRWSAREEARLPSGKRANGGESETRVQA